MCNGTVWIKPVQNRVGVLQTPVVVSGTSCATSTTQTHLAQTGGEDDNFIDFPHPPKEFVYTGAFEHVKVVPIRLYLHWNNVIWRWNGLYEGMSE